jgi:glycosyltransferase involved in cell wall biosynthesis
LKVLHVAPNFYPAWTYGGPIESLNQLCRHLGAAGCEVRVLTTDADGLSSVLSVEKHSPVQLSTNLQVRYCRRMGRQSISPSLLGALLPDLQWADVVHLTGVYSFPTFPTLLACRVLQKPLVWSPRGALQRWKDSRRQRLKWLWEAACRLVVFDKTVLHVTSEVERSESARRLSGVTTVVIGNGVALPSAVAHEKTDGRVRLLYFGRLDPKKGIENLLVACAGLSGSRRYSLAIAGAGGKPYVASLHGLIDKHSLAPMVTMMGPISPQDRGELFAKADVTVVPSYTENFCNVIAESLAHEVPVIASKGTPWARVEDRGCGLWVDNDPGSLAEAIERITSMPLREMGKKGRNWMAAEFSWRARAEQMLDIYLSLGNASLN